MLARFTWMGTLGQGWTCLKPDLISPSSLYNYNVKLYLNHSNEQMGFKQDFCLNLGQYVNFDPMQPPCFNGLGLFVLQDPNKSPVRNMDISCVKGAAEVNSHSQQIWLQQYEVIILQSFQDISLLLKLPQRRKSTSMCLKHTHARAAILIIAGQCKVWTGR